MIYDAASIIQDYAGSQCQNHRMHQPVLAMCNFLSLANGTSVLSAAPILARNRPNPEAGGQAWNDWDTWQQIYAVRLIGPKKWRMKIWTATAYSSSDYKWTLDNGVTKDIVAVAALPGQGGAYTVSAMTALYYRYGNQFPFTGVASLHEVVSQGVFGPPLPTEIMDFGYLMNCIYIGDFPLPNWGLGGGNNPPLTQSFGDLNFGFDGYTQPWLSCSTNKALIFWIGATADEIPRTQFSMPYYQAASWPGGAQPFALFFTALPPLAQTTGAGGTGIGGGAGDPSGAGGGAGGGQGDL